MNIFFKFIGKDQCVRSPEEYVQDKSLVKRTYVINKDKSWTQNDVSLSDVVKQASEMDVYSGIQIELMSAFGLRIREAISLKPHKKDYEGYLLVDDGTKGGRTRVVPIDTDYKRDVLDRAKKIVGRYDSNMCNSERTLYQEKARLYYILKKCGIQKSQLGVTAHGLRHEYLNDKYESITGHPSPVRGGEIFDKEKDKEARLKTMLDAGHGRAKIGAAYFGSTKMPK